MTIQTARHLLIRVSHRWWVSARLAQARSITATPLPSYHNMYARTLSTAKITCQRENMERSEPHHKPPNITVASASPNPATAMLQVYWGDGGMDVFPYVWLRDNCPCSRCFHPTAFSRLMSVENLQLSVTPTALQVTDGGDVEIQWSDGHMSTYPACWLQERAFKTTQQLQHEQVFRLKRSFWGSELAENLPRASFTELMEKDMTLLKFLQQLEILGLAVVSDTPRKKGQLESLSKRVGHLHKTHYGETFLVEYKPQPSNLAYTSHAINLHSDLVFCYQKPSIQLLHCIKQFPGKGGDNVLSDGLHAAQRLRSLHPDKFLTLANTVVEFWDKGKDNEKEFHIINRHPMIRLDPTGDILTINFHHMSRHSFFNVPVEKVMAWYDAMLTLYDFLHDPKNSLHYKLKEGDILVVDNMRILHGRTGYETNQGERLLEGGYWDWTLVSSMRRVLDAKLGVTYD